MEHPGPAAFPLPEQPAEFAEQLGLLLSDTVWALERDGDTGPAAAVAEALRRGREDVAMSRAAAMAMESATFGDDRLAELRRELATTATTHWCRLPDPDERVDTLRRFAERAELLDDAGIASDLYTVAVRECEASLSGDRDRRLVVLAQLLRAHGNVLDEYDWFEGHLHVDERARISLAEHLVRTCRRLAETDPDHYTQDLSDAHLSAAQVKDATDGPAAGIADAEAALRCYEDLHRRRAPTTETIHHRQRAVRVLTGQLRRAKEGARADEQERRWDQWLCETAAAPGDLWPQTLMGLGSALWKRDLRDEAIAMSRRAVDLLEPYATGKNRSSLDRLSSVLFQHADRLHEAGRRADAAETWRRFLQIERRRGRIVDGLDRVVRSVLTRDDTDLAVDFGAVRVTELTRLSEPDLTAFGPRLVTALRDQADRLRENGRSDAAADTAEQAVRWARTLARRQPRHRPLLADTLTEATFHHTRAFRGEDAERRSREALDVTEDLATTDPDRHRPDLANALHNRAVLLGTGEDNATARAVNTRALELYEDLVDDHPDLLGRLANALCTQAGILQGLHYNEAALACARRAVSVYTGLGDTAADAWIPDLCFAHSKVAEILRDQGEHAEARQAALAAVAASEELSPGDRRDAARLDALHAVVRTHVDSGHARDVVAYSAELVALRQRHADRDPAAGEPELAVSLENHALCLKRVGRLDESVDLARRSVTLYRRLAEAEPERYRPRLAGALDTVGLGLRALHRYEAALAASTEAMTLADELLTRDPSGNLAALSTVVDNHASNLDAAGDTEAALAVARRGIALSEELVAADRSACRHRLVVSLLNQVKRLNDLGRFEEAERTASRGIPLAQEQYELDPDAHRDSLAKLLHNHANALSAQDRIDEALPQLRRSAELGEAELRHDRYGGLMLLSLTLGFLARMYLHVGQLAPAEAPTRRSLRLWRELAEREPRAHRPGFVDALRELSRAWAEARGWDLAAETAAEGLDVCERLAATEPAEYWPQAASMGERLTRALAENGDRDGAAAATNRAMAARRAAVAAGCDDADVRQAATAVFLARPWLRLDDPATAHRQHADGVWRYRMLIADGRDDLRTDLANAQREFGIVLGDNGYRAEALPPLAEALSRIRRLAEQDRPANLRRLGEGLWDYAWYLRQAGEKQAAIPIAREAVSVIEECVAATDEDLGWEHANAHDILAGCLGDIGAVEESLDHSATALEYWESMAETDEEYLPDLAWSQWHRSRVLVERDGVDRPLLLLSQSAVAIYSRRVDDNPDEKPDLAGALVDHLRILDRGERPCGDYWDWALRLWRELAEQRPRLHRPGFADCLHHHAKHLLRRGRTDEARAETERAIAVYTRLPDGDRKAHVDGLVQARATLARINRARTLDLLPMSKKDGGEGPSPAPSGPLPDRSPP